MARPRRSANLLTTLMTASAVFGLAATHATAQAPPADAAKPGAKAAVTKTQVAGAAAGAGDGGLRTRVDSLEEQLVDMQVVVGTLESLAKSGGAQPAFSGSSGGADSTRVEALENQVRALSTHVQQLSEQVRSMGGVPRRSETTGAQIPSHADASSSFGSTTVTPGGDAIGGLITGSESSPPPSTFGGQPPPSTFGGQPPPSTFGGQPPPSTFGGQPPPSTFGGQPPPVATAALAPAGEGGDPKQLYETAYGYLLQRDYGAAEVAFDDFLKKYPSDSLSGNAQYWLGESHFVRGQYKAAASAFLKGYQTYAQSQKAPDSLLKLAMSLDRLGQKDAACSSYSELNTKFPNAPQSVKARAQSERQRVGCS